MGLANITVNKNAVPNDPQSPFVTSGVRLGTPAITTRGFKEKEVSIISNWICDVVLNNDDEKIINEIKNNHSVINFQRQTYVFHQLRFLLLKIVLD